MIKNYKELEKKCTVRVTGHKTILCRLEHKVTLSQSMYFKEKDVDGNEIDVPAQYCDIKVLQQYLIDNGFFPIPIHHQSIIHGLISRVYYKKNTTSDTEKLIIDIFNSDFWEDNLKTWKKIKPFTNINGALENIKNAIEMYNKGDFYSSNNLSVFLWEPIFRAILSKYNITNIRKQKKLKEAVFDLLRKDSNSEVIIDYLDKFSLAQTDKAPADMSHPVRNDVAHKSERIVTKKTALNSLFVLFYLLTKLNK